ncbi:MAG: hypothetical protein ACTS46_01030 [Candidatus Hodgkinia cicadicola]
MLRSHLRCKRLTAKRPTDERGDPSKLHFRSLGQSNGFRLHGWRRQSSTELRRLTKMVGRFRGNITFDRFGRQAKLNST